MVNEVTNFKKIRDQYNSPQQKKTEKEMINKKLCSCIAE